MCLMFYFTFRNDDLLAQTWQICLGIFVVKCLDYCNWLDMKTLNSSDLDYLVKLTIHMRGVTTFNTHQVLTD